MMGNGMPPGADDPGDWLRYIRNGGENRQWLLKYETHLVGVVRRGINTNHQFHDAVHLMKEIVPYFLMVHFHTDPWAKILIDALVRAQGLQNNKLQILIWHFIGEANIQMSRHKDANENFMTALERGETGAYPEMKLASYTGLFKLQWFDLNYALMMRLVDDALKTAQQVSDFNLRAGMHNELGRAFARSGDMVNALAHAQQAFIYWYLLGDSAGRGRAAFTLTTIYGYSKLMTGAPGGMKQSGYFLEIAKKELGDSEYASHQTRLDYESGAQCLYHEDGEVAAEWFNLALQEAENLGVLYYVAAARHGLGLAQTMTKDYETSRKNLTIAANLWEKLKNEFDQANALQALGYLEGLTAHKRVARHYLDEALRICAGLPDTPHRKALWDHIEASITEL